MADFKVIETQEQLDELIKDRLDRQKAKFNDVEENYKKEIESLKANIQANESKFKEANDKLQSHDEEVAKLNAEISTYKLESMKHKVAHENGLPYELAARLTGETEDALKQDAEALKKYVNKPQAIPLATPEVEPDGEKTSYEKALKKFSEQLKPE